MTTRSSWSADYVEVAVYPPSHRLEWSRPITLLYSLLKSTAAARTSILMSSYKSTFGHGIVHVSCKTTKGRFVDEWSGFTGDNNGVGLNAVLNDGAAIGVLFYTFDDGRLQSNVEVRSSLKKAAAKNSDKPHFIRKMVSTDQCDILVSHLKKFKEQDNLQYGFLVDPLTYAGAGCTSYVMSFLDVAGINEPIMERMKRKLEVSQAHIGNEFGNGPISFRTYLFYPYPWTYRGIPNESIEFYDPNRMDDFFTQAIKCAAEKKCKDQEIKQWVIDKEIRAIKNEFMAGIEIPL